VSSIAAPAPAQRAQSRGVAGFLLGILAVLIICSLLFPRIPQFVGGQPFIWIRDLIVSVLALFLPAWIIGIVLFVIGITFLLLFMTVVVMSLVYLERRVIAFMQDRLGPNRVGPEGLLQTVADVVKLMSKEDIIPSGADRPTFILAVPAAVMPSLLIYAVIQWAPGMSLADLNIGFLYVLAISSLTTISVVMAGWGSNNKYALLGAMRAAAQMISYEIPIVMSLVGVAMIVGSLKISDIIAWQQTGVWLFVLQPLGFLIYFTSSLAELNRTPFDLMEADSEIVAGYHIEYSGMRFALFFLAEYLNAFAAVAIAVTLFFGGWQGPILPPWLWFVVKCYALFFVLLWLRGTLPRVRIDQLMGLAWKGMIPLALVNILLTGVGILVYRVLVGQPI
jgi:NADH-quinone oxidoreductase subunit H